MVFESPDGKCVYYTKEEGTEGLWRMPLGGVLSMGTRVNPVFIFDL